MRSTASWMKSSNLSGSFLMPALVEILLVVGDDVVLEAPRNRPLPARAQRVAGLEIPSGGGAQSVEDVLEVVVRPGGRGVLQPRVEVLDPSGGTVLPDEVGTEHERVVLAGAARQLGVELGEVVGLGHQVGVDVDSGELGEFLEQRLIGLLVRVRRLQDVDCRAGSLLPVEPAGDVTCSVRGVRPTAHSACTKDGHGGRGDATKTQRHQHVPPRHLPAGEPLCTHVTQLSLGPDVRPGSTTPSPTLCRWRPGRVPSGIRSAAAGASRSGPSAAPRTRAS